MVHSLTLYFFSELLIPFNQFIPYSPKSFYLSCHTSILVFIHTSYGFQSPHYTLNYEYFLTHSQVYVFGDCHIIIPHTEHSCFFRLNFHTYFTPDTFIIILGLLINSTSYTFINLFQTSHCQTFPNAQTLLEIQFKINPTLIMHDINHGNQINYHLTM